jgi:hypothetical protein
MHEDFIWVWVKSSEPIAIPTSSSTSTDIKLRVQAGYKFWCTRTAQTTSLHLSVAHLKVKK